MIETLGYDYIVSYDQGKFSNQIVIMAKKKYKLKRIAGELIMDFLLTDKDAKQLEELHFKSKLLTTEMFLKSGKPQKRSYEIGDKKYFFEERQNEITYKVSESDK